MPKMNESKFNENELTNVIAETQWRLRLFQQLVYFGPESPMCIHESSTPSRLVFDVFDVVGVTLPHQSISVDY